MFEEYEKSLRGWMVRDARSELVRAINNCSQNVMAHIEEEKIPSQQLPVALRDPAMSKNFVKSFAGHSMIDWLIGCTVRAARGGDTESVEMLCGVAYETCAVLRDISTKHYGTDAQRERLAEIAKVNSAFPVLVRRHMRANKVLMQALERMGLGDKSWIRTDPGKKYGVDSPLNRYLIRVIPDLQQFCDIDLKGSIHQHSVRALPMLESCRDARLAQAAFDSARALFIKTGKPVKRTAMEWVKLVFVPLIQAKFGDPYDDPIVPTVSETKLVGAGGGDKSSRSPRERLVHYVFMALKGMLGDRQNDTKQVN